MKFKFKFFKGITYTRTGKHHLRISQLPESCEECIERIEIYECDMGYDFHIDVHQEEDPSFEIDP